MFQQSQEANAHTIIKISYFSYLLITSCYIYFYAGYVNFYLYRQRSSREMEVSPCEVLLSCLLWDIFLILAIPYLSHLDNSLILGSHVMNIFLSNICYNCNLVLVWVCLTHLKGSSEKQPLDLPLLPLWPQHLAHFLAHSREKTDEERSESSHLLVSPINPYFSFWVPVTFLECLNLFPLYSSYYFTSQGQGFLIRKAGRFFSFPKINVPDLVPSAFQFDSPGGREHGCVGFGLFVFKSLSMFYVCPILFLYGRRNSRKYKAWYRAPEF